MSEEKIMWVTRYKRNISNLILITLLFGLFLSLLIEFNYLEQIKSRSVNEIMLESNLFANEMESQSTNLLYLSDIHTRVRERITDPVDYDESMKGVLSDFIKENLVYDQVRILDLDGHELFRVNRVNNEVIIIPDDELQDKSDRYYFVNAQALERDEILVSRFDLNIEYDEIETPIKPVYRLVTPIDLNDGSRLGYLVLNILGEPVLNHIHQADQSIFGNVYLTNENGDWLIGPEDTTPWGFMYEDAERFNISETFPGIWQKFNDQDLDFYQGFCTNGLFTFHRIGIVNKPVGMDVKYFSGIQVEKWILISFIPFRQAVSSTSIVIFIATIIVAVLMNIFLRQQVKIRLSEEIAYRAREESEKKLQIISDASQDAIILINSKGLIEYWSGSAEKMFGYSSDEVLNKEVHDIITMHQDDRALAQRKMGKFAQNGKGPILNTLREMDAKTRDGKLIPAEISINPIKIGDEWWAAGIVRDITKRREAQKEIRELAQFPLENTNAVMRFDLQGELIYANPASDFLLRNWNLAIGQKLKDPLRKNFLDEIASGGKSRIRIEIKDHIYSLDIFPVVDSGYANVYGVDITEEETARKELQASELKYRTLLNSMPQYIFHKDVEGRYITINKALSELLNMEPSHFVGKTDFDLFPGDISEKHSESDRQVLEQGIPYEADEMFFPQEDDKKIAHIVKTPVYDANGAVTGILGIFWDITKQVQAEKGLAELNKNLEGLVQKRTKEIEIINKELSISKERYQAIIENQVEFVFRWDLKGNITYSNHSFSDRFNKKNKDIVGKYYKDTISSARMDELYKKMADITQDNTFQTLEIRDVLSDGQVVWEQWNSRAIFNDRKEIVEVQNVGRDITELKQAQEQVYIQSSALEAAANGIVITDVDGKIIWVNRAMSNLTGYEVKELIDENPRIFKSGMVDDVVYEGLWNTILAGKVWSGEVINRKKDGSLYTEEMTITPILSEGKVINFIAIKQDITARKQIEQEVREAKEQAEIANSAKSIFLANMSHEIRTPLNAIMGLNYLLRRTGLTDIQQKYLGKMQTASKNLLDMINDVLDYSKIEAQKIEIEKMPFDLETIFIDITDTEALKAHQKGIELIVSSAEDIPERLQGDPIRLKQVLRNLVNNAIKFTESGEVVVEVKKTAERKDSITLLFSVTDTGIGLSQEQINKLFTPFQQADISTTRKFGGTGLGLAISQRIVSLMHGKIWVESELNKGSKFFFEIPFRKLPPKKKADLFASKEVIGKKVLIVDSNVKSYKWLDQLLKPTQAQISHVADKDTLKEIINSSKAEDQFDVILINNNVRGFRRLSDLLDLKMRLKSEEVKVIHLTDTVQFAQRVQDEGSSSIDSVLIKPINASQLYDTWIALFTGNRSMARKHTDAGSQETRNDLTGLKILLTEDNEINQEVITELLKQKNVAVTVADNGQAALDLISKEKFDLVLMDIQMPIMDGFTASRKIRKQKKFDAMPILALTANALVEEKEKARRAGMDDYITKPIEPGLFFEKIAHWTKREKVDVEKTPVDSILSIPGVNVEKGLLRLNDDQAAYIALLNKFVSNHGGDLKQIEENGLKEDWEKAGAKLHAMKGAAANLSAVELVDALEKIESSIRDKHIDEFKNSIDLANALFNKLKKEIGVLYRTSIIKEESKPSLGKNDLREKLERLQQLVNHNDPEAKVVLKEIRLAGSLGNMREMLDDVQAALDRYQFKRAGALLEDVLRKI